ncbi:MAG: pirin family protein [Dehalococcoidia bacterium]
MPAVTADTLTLPRLADLPEKETQWRPVAKVVTAQRAMEGEGFIVRRPFPSLDFREADPFVLLDHIGAVEYAPGEAKGTPWHPHRGFETVTYIMDGAFEHQDTTGGGGVISDGATQWMTAGAGIQHIEQPPERLVAKGGMFHGTQLWVNLPAAQKFVPARYQSIEATDVTLVSSADGASLVRIIAGEVDGHGGAGVTYTPITYLHATVAPGSRLGLPWPRAFNALVYVLAGRGYAGPEQRPFEEGQLAAFGAGDALSIAAAESQPSTASGGMEVLVLGGLPIREPVVQHGPFVMNTRDEIAQAVADYHAGRMGVVPASWLPRGARPLDTPNERP